MADALSPAGIPPCDAWLIAVPVPGRNRRSGELIKSMNSWTLMGLNMFEWMFMGLMDVCGFGFSWVCFFVLMDVWVLMYLHGFKWIL